MANMDKACLVQILEKEIYFRWCYQASFSKMCYLSMQSAIDKSIAQSWRKIIRLNIKKIDSLNIRKRMKNADEDFSWWDNWLTYLLLLDSI